MINSNLFDVIVPCASNVYLWLHDDVVGVLVWRVHARTARLQMSQFFAVTMTVGVRKCDII
jgi:hypothetical protein